MLRSQWPWRRRLPCSEANGDLTIPVQGEQKRGRHIKASLENSGSAAGCVRTKLQAIVFLMVTDVASFGG